MVHGSLTWAQKENNPWHHDCPVVGTLHQAEARSYLDTRGVFVRLENGIDAFLAGQQVPGGAEDISRAVDLGDVLSVQITAVRKDVLEVDCSVRAALQTLQHQEERRRREEFSQDLIRPVSLEDFALPREESIRLAVLGPDKWFTRQLLQWLDVLGIVAVSATSSRQLLAQCRAQKGPTHVVSIPDLWQNQAEYRRFGEILQEKAIRLLWLRVSNGGLPPLDAPAMGLPLDVGQLFQWLRDPCFRPQSDKPRGPFREHAYQLRLVQDKANELLGAICRHHRFTGALWVKRQRKGIYTPLASHGLDVEAVETVRPFLDQSAVVTTIKQDEWVFRALSTAGPLKRIAPPGADYLCCLPLAYRSVDGTASTKRAIVFFYRFQDHFDNSRVKDLLAPYIPAMQSLLLADEYARQNELLTTLANLGINSGAYLHELGQAALPIKGFLERLGKENAPLDAKARRRLKKELDKLLRMSRTNLAAIRRKRAPSFALRRRLEEIVRLFSYRAAPMDCSVRVLLPDHPMVLTLSSLFFDQVLNNLLDNGLHFVSLLPARMGRIQVRVGLDARDSRCPLWIDIEDNGPGIRASKQDAMFEMRQSDKERGTGMGLFNARSFLNGLGGRLELRQSVRWQRTIFRIRLPIKLERQIR